MARNIEIKAHVPDRRRLEARVRDLADGPPLGICQDDTFVGCRRGRLKLRNFKTEPPTGELIHYARTDTAGPAMASYARFETDQPAAL